MTVLDRFRALMRWLSDEKQSMQDAADHFIVHHCAKRSRLFAQALMDSTRNNGSRGLQLISAPCFNTRVHLRAKSGQDPRLQLNYK